ncbi:MAG: PxxKW family cysteine-rich protein [Desulfobacteraceae bacterium]|nr:PxxKW family cysteine-rich protein [Desulfobacteraceae bacterium]
MAKATNASAAVYASGEFQPIVEKCEGCERIVEAESTRYCRTYAEPAAKWKLGLCNFATHVKPEITIAKTKINPLKASKRAAAGKK